MNEEIDLLDLFFAFWKRKIWLIVAVVIGAILGFVYTRYFVTPMYTSSVTLILGKASTDATVDSTGAITQSDIALNQKLISTYSEIMKSRRVSNKVISNLNLKMTYSQISSGIKVSSVKDSDVIKLSITTDNPELSAKIADEMTSVFTDEVKNIYNIQNVSVIDVAEVNRAPVNIRYTKNIVVFAFALFTLTAVVIFLIYYFDNTIKTEENIQKLTDLPVLSTIPNIESKKGGKKHA